MPRARCFLNETGTTLQSVSIITTFTPPAHPTMLPSVISTGGAQFYLQKKSIMYFDSLVVCEPLYIEKKSVK